MPQSTRAKRLHFPLRLFAVIALVVGMHVANEATALLIPISSSAERFDVSHPSLVSSQLPLNYGNRFLKISPNQHFDYDARSYEKRFDPYEFEAPDKRDSSEERGE